MKKESLIPPMKKEAPLKIQGAKKTSDEKRGLIKTQGAKKDLR
jgi:hypothetical protein